MQPSVIMRKYGALGSPLRTAQFRSVTDNVASACMAMTAMLNERIGLTLNPMVMFINFHPI